MKQHCLLAIGLLLSYTAWAQVDSATLAMNKKGYTFYAAMYADNLLSIGKADKAYDITSRLYQDDPESMGYMYLQTLVATDRLKEAFPLAVEQYKQGTASDEVKAKFKAAYVKVKGTDKGFEEYKAQLEAENTKRMRDEVAKLVVNEPSIDFTLKDVNGKTVTLSECKGKVVILDFWATWCGPCKASFPSMQAAVNKYQHDNDVIFLFIHTLDKGSGDPTAEAQKYITNNKYTFHVLMDLRDQTTHKSKVADDYKLEGIPAKFVIDRNGKVRFKLTGFGGNKEAAVNELSAMIEYVKQEDSTFTFLFNAIKSETDAGKMEYLVHQLIRKDEPGKDVLIDYSLSHLAETFAEEGNIPKAFSYLSQVKDSEWIVNTTLSVSQQLTAQNKLAEAEKLLTPFLHQSKEIDFVYGMIYYKKGNYKQALKYLSPSSYSPEYAMALIHAGDKASAMSATRAYILQTGTTNETFRKFFNNDHYYKNFLDSVQAVRKANAIAKMTKFKTDTPAPDFSITDVNGKVVSLTTLKGKTILIDFWATWCVPCVGSFPGMQLAANHFAKDTNVVFMFVHTSERSQTATADAQKLLEKKHYNFDLYMDLGSPMAKAFQVNALPTKVVIDKNGIIKCRNTGYVSAEEAVDEISAMINMAKF